MGPLTATAGSARGTSFEWLEAVREFVPCLSAHELARRELQELDERTMAL
jgi:hypothetical protein